MTLLGLAHPEGGGFLLTEVFLLPLFIQERERLLMDYGLATCWDGSMLGGSFDTASIGYAYVALLFVSAPLLHSGSSCPVLAARDSGQQGIETTQGKVFPSRTFAIPKRDFSTLWLVVDLICLN